MPIKRPKHRKSSPSKLSLLSNGFNAVYKYRDKFYKVDLTPEDFKRNHLLENPLAFTATEIKNKGYKFVKYC